MLLGAGDPTRLSRLNEIRRGPRQRGPGAQTFTTLAALGLALAHGPAEEAAELTHEAFEDSVLIAFDPVAMLVAVSVVLALADPGVWPRSHETTRQRLGDAVARPGCAMGPAPQDRPHHPDRGG